MAFLPEPVLPAPVAPRLRAVPGSNLRRRPTPPAPRPAPSRLLGPTVMLVTEGTYPHAHGGVSVWCDQLVRGLPEVPIEVVALTAFRYQRPVWDVPRTVGRVTTLGLWDARRPRRLESEAALSPAAVDLARLLAAPTDDVEGFRRLLDRLARAPVDEVCRPRRRHPAAARPRPGRAGQHVGPARRGPGRRPRERGRDARPPAAPPGHRPGAGRDLPRQLERPRRPGLHDGPASPRRPVPAHRARHLPAGALPRAAPHGDASGGQGPPRAVPPAGQRRRLRRGRGHRARQPLEPAVGGPLRRARRPGADDLQRRRPRRVPDPHQRARRAGRRLAGPHRPDQGPGHADPRVRGGGGPAGPTPASASTDGWPPATRATRPRSTTWWPSWASAAS